MPGMNIQVIIFDILIGYDDSYSESILKIGDWDQIIFSLFEYVLLILMIFSSS